MKILKATGEDAGELASLGVQLALFSVSISGFTLKKKVFSRIKAFMKRRFEKDVFFKAVEKGKIIGYARLSKKKEHALYGDEFLNLSDLVVDEKYQHKGVGSALIEKSFSYAKAKGFHSMQISAYAENKKALELYKKKGFKPHKITLKKSVLQTKKN